MPAKYKIITQILKEEIMSHRNEGTYRLPTESELCRRFGVSRETIRHSLKLLTEDGLIRSRQGSGHLVPDSHYESLQKIAVITTFEDEYIFPAILHDMESVLRQHGFKINVYSTLNRVQAEREILNELLRHPVGGIIAEGSKTALPNPNNDLYLELKKRGTPIVFFQGISRDLQQVIPYVIDDNYNGGYDLASYLIGSGYRRIGGIFKSDDIQGLERYSGLMHALRDSNLTLPDKTICWFDTDQRSRIIGDKSSKTLKTLWDERLSYCDSIICYNDEIAYHLIRFLKSKGISVPEDIAIVSFDNSYYSKISPVGITSMWHNNQKMGIEVSNLLLQLMRGKKATSKVLTWELIERDSGKVTYSS